MLLEWPPILLDEHKHWDKHNKCLKANDFNKRLSLRGKKEFRADLPPCFFVGQIEKSKIVLLGLNPGLNDKRMKAEKKIIKELGWEKAYLTFFDWFAKEGLYSQYYSRFAVFLSGYLGFEHFQKERRERYNLLGENIVNLDLIPYHSVKFTNKVVALPDLLDVYVKNLRAMLELVKPEVVFMNGAAFRPFLALLGVKPIHSPTVICVNEKKKRDLEIQYGYMELGQKNIWTVWLTNFLTGQSLAATNDGLFQAGKSVKSRID